VSLGLITKTFPLARVLAILTAAEKSSVRQRDLPAHVVVYVIVLALYMQSSYREVLRCMLEEIQWLRDPSATIRVAGKSGISQARLAWAGSHFANCTMRWSDRSRCRPPKAPGMARGGW